MMGLPLVPSSWGKAAIKRWKGKTPCIRIKSLDKIRPKDVAKPKKRRRFRPGMKALCEICGYQKLTELLIPKLPFL